jgi:hypothetical protein
MTIGPFAPTVDTIPSQLAPTTKQLPDRTPRCCSSFPTKNLAAPARMLRAFAPGGPEDSPGTAFMAITPERALLRRRYGIGGAEGWTV